MGARTIIQCQEGEGLESMLERAAAAGGRVETTDAQVVVLRGEDKGG